MVPASVSPTTDPLLSVIIVNFNGRHHLEECFGALERQTLPRSIWEAVLVDNASVDGSVEFVARRFPRVRIVRLEKNLGFAAGNNIGIQHARGRLLALLNNDTAADSRWLAELIAAAEAHPNAGGIAGKIVFHRDPSLLQSTGLVLYRDGRGGDRGFRERDIGQYEASGEEVFGGCGAGMLLRRELIEDIGGFDERLFMYYEDLDLAWRARWRGWSFVYAPRAVIRHVHCASSGEWSPFFTFHVERNRVLVNVKNNTALRSLWIVAGFLGRLARAWYRIMRDRNRGSTRLTHGWAYLRAAGSILLLMPAALTERCVIRSRRRVRGRELKHWQAPPPARAA